MLTFVLKWLLILASVISMLANCADCKKRRKEYAPGYELLFSSNTKTFLRWNVPLTGRSPRWLKGMLVKNGPGQFSVGPTSFTHWFDGYAKICMFKFTGNQSMEFSTKVLPSKSYNSSTYYGDITPYMFFSKTNPPLGAIQKMQALMHQTDNCPVNIVKFPSSNGEQENVTQEVAILSDTWNMYVFNIENFVDIKKVVPSISDGTHRNHMVPLISSAHPLPEYNKPTYITLLSELNPIPFQNDALHLVRIHTNEEREILVTIPIEKIAYMHSFGLSINHAVLFYDPVFISPESVLEHSNLLSGFNWDPTYQTRIYVINLLSGHIFHMYTKPGVHLHHVNTYEEQNHLICDFIVYPDINFLLNMDLTIMKNATLRRNLIQNGTLMRYDIHLKKERVRRHRIRSVISYARYMDLPSINEAYRFKKYCFVYTLTTGLYGGDVSVSGIIKKDLCHGKDLIWSKTYHYSSEPTFVANPQGKQEDDGVVTAVVLDGQAAVSYILVLDAQTFNILEGAYLPTYIPNLIHGRFFEH